MSKHTVLWKEKRKHADSHRPEWEEFEDEGKAEEFAFLVKKDPLARSVRIHHRK